MLTKFEYDSQLYLLYIYGGPMKRRYLSILAPAALALVITGCGKAADKSMSAESIQYRVRAHQRKARKLNLI